MLLMILQKLEFDNLKTIMLVSRFWRCLGGDPVLWRKFKLIFLENPNKFIPVLSIPRLAMIEHVTLDGLYEFRAKYSDSHINFLGEMNLKLLEIDDIADLSDVSPELLAKLVNQCEVVDLGYSLTEDQMYEIFEEMSHVTKLTKFWLPDNVQYVPADTLAKALANIKDVTLTNLTRAQVLNIFIMMSKETSKTIHLNTHTANLTHLASSVFCSAVARMQSLRGSLSPDKMSSLMNMISITTNLTHLHLGQSELTQVPAGVLARGLVMVETVEMMWTGVDTKQIIELCREISKDHSVVKHLHLNHDLSDVPADILATAVNKLETAGILTCEVTEEQTDKIFTEMSRRTNIKRINYNDLRAPLSMPGIRNVAPDTLARAVNKLVDVLIHVGDAAHEISGPQLVAILEQSCVRTSLRQARIFSGGATLPGTLVQSVARNIANFFIK